MSKLEWNKQNAICFELIVPEELAESRFEIMKLHLEMYFGYKAFVDERIRPVKILRQINKGKNKFIKESDGTVKTSARYGGSGLSMKNSPIETLIGFIESQTNMPLIDETNLFEKYDLEIDWYNENPEQIHQELKKIGLELVSDERKIKVLVIIDK